MTLTQGDYGIFNALVSIGVTISAFLVGYIGTPYLSIVARCTPAEKGEYTKSLQKHFLCVALIGAAVCGIVMAVVAHRFATITTPVVVGFVVYMLGLWVRDFVRSYYLGRLKFKEVACYSGMVSFFVIIVMGGLSQFNLLDLSNIFFVVGVTFLVFSWVAVSLQKKAVFWLFMRPQFRLKKKAEHWNIGKWLIYRAAVSAISGSLYVVLVVWLRGAKEGGVLAAYLLPASLISPLGQALSTYYTPIQCRLVVELGRSSSEVVVRDTLRLLFVSVIFSIVASYVGIPILSWIFSDEYCFSQFELLLFTFQSSVVVIGVPANSHLIAIQKTMVGFVGELMSSLFTLTGGLALVYSFGVTGASVGMLLSRLINRGFNVYYVKYRCPLDQK